MLERKDLATKALRLIPFVPVANAIGLLIFARTDRTKVKEISPEEQEANPARFTSEIKGDFMLLALKYEIEEEKLTRVVIDYEWMTQGYSVTEEMISMISSEEWNPATVRRKLVDPLTAVNDLSQRHGIPKRVLSSILIERKMMRAAERRSSDDGMPLDEPPIEGWR